MKFEFFFSIGSIGSSNFSWVALILVYFEPITFMVQSHLFHISVRLCFGSEMGFGSN